MDSASRLIAKATPAGDDGMLKSAIALLERSAIAAPTEVWPAHYLGYALYRYATLAMGRDRANASAWLERADSVLERAESLGNVPETQALRSGLSGMMIGSNPLRAITLGPKSGMQIGRAMELGPNNPRVWLLRGIGAFNTPSAFGGGADKAEEYLKKSVQLFASDKPKPPAPAWGVSEAHAWLGQAYAEQGKTDSARASYAKALELEPNDGWVRNVLLPALDKKK